MHLNQHTGLITFTSRNPPKVLRAYRICTQCGRPDALGELLQPSNCPTWELWLDSTGPAAALPQKLCFSCGFGE